MTREFKDVQQAVAACDVLARVLDSLKKSRIPLGELGPIEPTQLPAVSQQPTGVRRGRDGADGVGAGGGLGGQSGPGSFGAAFGQPAGFGLGGQGVGAAGLEGFGGQGAALVAKVALPVVRAAAAGWVARRWDLERTIHRDVPSCDQPSPH
jgi:hypothetical protein